MSKKAWVTFILREILLFSIGSQQFSSILGSHSSVQVSPAVLVGLERGEREDRLRTRIAEPVPAVDVLAVPQNREEAARREIALRKTYVAKLHRMQAVSPAGSTGFC